MDGLTVRLIILIVFLYLPHLAIGSGNKVVEKNASESTIHEQPALDDQSGLVKADGFNLVLAHCSACHSPSLITQNAMNRERWLETIRWMQDTQKLWPLGEAEPLILDYLSTWYGPKKSARRAPLPPHLLPAN